MRDWWILRFVDQHIHNPYHLVSCVISRLLAEDKFRIWSSKICVQTSNKLVQTRDEISDRYTNIVQLECIWNLHYIVHILSLYYFLVRTTMLHFLHPFQSWTEIFGWESTSLSLLHARFPFSLLFSLSFSLVFG